MRFLVLVFAPSGEQTAQVAEAMARHSRELVDAGVVLATDALHPVRRGGALLFHGDGPAVPDEPADGCDPCLTGYWILECASREEALERVRRAPFDGGVKVELRQVAQDGLGGRMTTRR